MKKSPKKKVSKSKIRYINCEVFPVTVMFSVKNRHAEIIKHLKKHKASEWIAAIDGEEDFWNSTYMHASKRDIRTKAGKMKSFFFLQIRDDFDFSDDMMCDLAHECVHLCQFIMPLFLDRNKEIEAEAYFHSFLMGKCLKILRS